MLFKAVEVEVGRKKGVVAKGKNCVNFIFLNTSSKKENRVKYARIVNEIIFPVF